MHNAPSRLDRRELIKKTLAIGAAGYVAPMVIGSVTTVNAQTLSGGVCSTASCSLTCGVGGGSGTVCSCVATSAGPIVCVDPLCGNVSCTSNSDCPSGQVCFNNVIGCCGGNTPFCVPICTGSGGGGNRNDHGWRTA